MKAVFKREFHSYMTNITGSIFIAVSVAVMGFFVLFTNLLNMVPQVEYGLMGSVIAFIITIPFLCMRAYSPEKKNGNLKFLIASGVSPCKLVIGKYLAMIAMLAVPAVITAAVPIILSAFGGVVFEQSYASIFAYFMLGASLIAICTFIGSQSKNYIVSLIISIIALLTLYTAPTLAKYLPTSPAVSLAAILALNILIAVLVWATSRSIILSSTLLLLSEAVTLIFYFTSKAGFTSLFYRIMISVSPFERFKTFTQGIFNLSDLIYLLSISALFVFFTYCSVAKIKRGDAKITKSDSDTARLRHRSAIKKSAITASASIAVLIAINSAIAFIPAGLISFDASGLDMYTLSEKSKAFLKSVDDDVTLYLLSEDGIADTPTEAILREYEAVNPHIDYKKVNISANPGFLTKYAGIAYDKTDDDGNRVLNNNSVIIESAKRYTVIDSSRFYHYRVGTESYSEAEFLAFCNQLAAYGYNLSGIEYKTYFDIDKVITSGIEYVALDAVSTVFTLTGHGEKPVTSEFYSNLRYAGIPYEDITLSEHDAVPEHCSALIIVAPETDLSAQDAGKITEYIKRGGNLLLITSPENAEMENLLGVTKEFGLTAKPGTIHDTHVDYYQNNGEQYDLIPNANTGHDIVGYIKSAYGAEYKPRFPNSHAIIKNGTTPKNAAITEMLATSDKAVRVSEDEVISSGYEQYFTGYSVKLSASDGNAAAQLIWYSSYDAFTDDYLISRPINNVYFLTSLSYIGGADRMTSSLSIDSRDISGSFLEITKPALIIWGSVFAVIIPLIILGTGITVYTARKKRKLS